MSHLQAFLLGLLQGVTEFLPVSSSGHLLVMRHLFNLEAIPVFFDVALHGATLLSVFIFFRRDLIFLILSLPAFFRKNKTPEQQRGISLIGILLMTTLLTVLVAPWVAKWLPLSLRQCSFLFLATAALLAASPFFSRGTKTQPQKTQAVAIGLGQGFTILPGLSRSGVTIAIALAMGMEREAACRFSFLLSIPIISAALVFQGIQEFSLLWEQVELFSFLIAFGTAFFSGLLAIRLILSLVRKRLLYLFAIYLTGVGVVGLFLL